MKKIMMLLGAALFSAVQAWAYDPGERVTNGKFEDGASPASGWKYKSGGAAATGWTFTDACGISRASDTTWVPWYGDNRGTSVPFIQNGSISQTVYLPVSGTYKLGFCIISRTNHTGQRVYISLGSSQKSVYVDDSSSWDWYTMYFSVSTAGNYTLTFSGSNGSTDACSAFDCVSLTLNSYSGTVSCADWSAVKAMLAEGYSVKVANKIELWESNTPIKANSNVTFDLNGYDVVVGQNNRIFAYDSGTMTIISSTGGGCFRRNSNYLTSPYTYGGSFACLNGSAKMILNSGTIGNSSYPLYCSHSSDGGAITVRGTAKFTMNGGTISSCKSAYFGGAVVLLDSTAEFEMNGGTITGCKAESGVGGAVYAVGKFTMSGGTISGNTATSSRGGGVAVVGSSAKFEMTGGTISGNTVTGTAANTGNGAGVLIESSATGVIRGGSIKNNTANRYGGGILNNSGKLEVYGGEISGNKATTGDGGGIQTDYAVGGTTSTKIYGGVVKGNTANGGHSCLYSNMTSSQNTTVYGGVFDKKPTSASYIGLGSGCAETQVGSLYVVGQAVLASCGKIVNGSLTFNPTAAEYVAAGVAPDSTKTTTSGSSTSYTVAPKDAIIEVNAWSEVKSALEAGKSVKLVADVTHDGTTVTLAGTQKVTLDLNGYTVTKVSNVRIVRLNSANAKLTLTDTSASKTGKIVQASGSLLGGVFGGAVIVDAGEIVIEDGTYSGLSCNGNGGFLAVSSGAKFTMNGGVITGCQTMQGSGGAINNQGAFTMNGGMIKDCTAVMYCGAAVCNMSSGAFTMNGGIITNCVSKYSGGAIYLETSSSSFTMNGGTISGCSTAGNGGVVHCKGTFTMNGGVLTGNSANGSITTASALFYNEGGTITVNGGVSDNSHIDDFKASGYACTQIGTSYVVGSNVLASCGALVNGTYTFCLTNDFYYAAGVTVDVAKCTIATDTTKSPTNYVLTANADVVIDGSTWTEVQTAFAAGMSVKLTANVTQDSGAITLADSKTATLDLAGFVLKATSGSAVTLGANANLTITNSDETATHYFTVGSNGLWTWNDDNKTGAVAYETLTARPAENAIIAIKGGCITGATGSGIYQNVGSTLVINGGTIVGNGNSNNLGGGVYQISGGASYLTLNAGRVCGNRCNQHGAGFYAHGDGTFTINGGDIAFNTAVWVGGGICGGYVNLNGGRISWNSCGTVDGHGGGGIYTRKTIIMTGGEIVGNTTTLHGGGVNALGTFEMTGGIISNCTAATNGGAICLESSSGKFTMNGGVLAGNTASNGGALYVLTDSRFEMFGGEISGNTVTGSASGYGCGGGVAGGGTKVIYGGRIVGNTAARYAGGIFNNGGTLTVYGGTLSGNTAPDDKGGAIDSDADGQVTFYGGVVTDNVGGNFKIEVTNGMTVNGGAFDDNPTSAANVSLGTGCTSLLCGDNYVVGSNVLASCGALVNGTYTFCPTNDIYSAAGVTVDVAKCSITVDATKSPTNYVLTAAQPIEVGSWSEVKSALAAGMSVKVMDDIQITQQNDSLYMTGGKACDIELDLNGHTIDGYNVATGGEKDRIFVISGADAFNLTLSDSVGGGAFVGHSTVSHGGAFAFVGGACKLTINDVTIRNFTSLNSGGAIYVATPGTLEMTGGTITNCATSISGGAIWSSGTVVMTGGTIVGNRAETLGGGIHVDSTAVALTLGGDLQIVGNTVKSAANNVYLASGKTIAISATTPLTADAKIGVTTATAPIAGSPVAVTGVNAADVSDFFFSDNTAYYADNGADNAVRLALVGAGPTVKDKDKKDVVVEIPTEWRQEQKATPEDVMKPKRKMKNGMPAWQNYVLGIDPTNELSGVYADAPQNKATDAVTIETKNITQSKVASGYAVKYRLDKKLTGASEYTKGEKRDEPSFDVLLNGDDPSGVYKLNTVIVKDGVELDQPAEAVNTIGLVKATNTNKFAIVAVPWSRLAPGEEEEIAVSNVLKTATLEAGDKLHVFNRLAKTYDTWTLNEQKEWDSVVTYAIAADGTLSASISGASATETIARGSGIWLERMNPTNAPYFLYGQVSASELPAILPGHNLVGAPGVEAFDFSRVKGAAEGDQILVPGVVPKLYELKDGVWGYSKTVAKEINVKGTIKTSFKAEWTTTENTIPAGTGYWLINKSGNNITIE